LWALGIKPEIARQRWKTCSGERSVTSSRNKKNSSHLIHPCREAEDLSLVEGRNIAYGLLVALSHSIVVAPYALLRHKKRSTEISIAIVDAIEDLERSRLMVVNIQKTTDESQGCQGYRNAEQ
jgi:hypothetical protein